MMNKISLSDLNNEPATIASQLNSCLNGNNLTNEVVGKIIGVSGRSVARWTTNKHSICKKNIPAVESFLGRFNWFGVAPPPVITPTVSVYDPYPNIPQELKKIPRWLIWKSVKDSKTGKIKKIPVNAAGYPVSGKDSKNWMSFKAATASSKNIGFQFSNEDSICGIDLDNCVDIHTGELEEWASDIVFSFGSYTETSPSGTGLHIICKADVDHTGINKGNLEMYSRDRFFTFTGIKFDGDSIEDCTEEYKKLLAEHQKPDTPMGSEVDTSPLTAEDHALKKKMVASKQGIKFKALANGDISNYPSQSDADLALCNILAFWCRKDSAQMDRIFRSTSLYRDKWDSMRGDTTYGQITITKAIAGCKEVYRKDSIPAEYSKTDTSNSKPATQSSITVEQLAVLSPLEYDSHRKKIAKEMGIRVSVLDDEVAKLRKDEIVTTAAFEDLEPWNEEVNGIELLNEIRAILKNHLIVQKGVDIAISLWVLLSYYFDEFRILPLLGITSPEKRCGKTTCAEVLQGLVNKPLLASNISSAVLFRIIEKYHPTMIIDEADTFLVDNDEMRGVFNAGHTRKSAFVWRCNSETNEPEKFSVWGAKAVLMIGDLPGTMKDRAIPARMKRKAPGESVKKLTLDFDDKNQHIREKCLRWCDDNSLKGTDPKMPNVGNDRATDNWSPLLAIADKIGGDWPELARSAMVILETDEMNDKESAGQMVLEDIKKVFDKIGGKRISSKNLVTHLVAMDHRPWCEWKRGKPLTQNSLSKLLKPYGVKPKVIRYNGRTPRGFKLGDFQDSFKRYLLSPKTPSQSATAQQVYNTSMLGGKQSATQGNAVALQKPSNYLESKDCCAVALQNPILGKEGKKEGIHSKWEEIK